MNWEICKSPWCKSKFEWAEFEMVDNKPPQFCKKCRSFENELSGGIKWEDKQYEDEPYIGQQQLVKYKINKYF